MVAPRAATVGAERRSAVGPDLRLWLLLAACSIDPRAASMLAPPLVEAKAPKLNPDGFAWSKAPSPWKGLPGVVQLGPAAAPPRSSSTSGHVQCHLRGTASAASPSTSAPSSAP